MENDKDNLFEINPVKNYEAPKLPTLQGVRGDSEFLKKLPSRWRKNAAVITCIGLMGASTFSLSGCDGLFGAQFRGEPLCTMCSIERQPHRGEPVYTICSIEQEPLVHRTHHGGCSGDPTYVVHLTEQEAFSIIRAHLEAAGLRFNSTPPDYTYELWGSLEIGLDLFDEDKGAAISFINISERRVRGSEYWRLADRVERGLKEQTDISIGVFYNPDKVIGQNFSDFSNWSNDPEAEERARAYLERRVNNQARRFLLWLQSEGIL